MNTPEKNKSAAPQSDPPAFTWWLLTHALASHLREPMLGDIEEQYQMTRANRGAQHANQWLWREAFCAPLTRLHRPTAIQRAHKFTGDSRMTTLQSDLQFAWRMLVRRPAFTVLAVFTLALGIGATTAIFSAVNPILFESLPYPNADQIHMVWEGIDPAERNTIGYTTYADIAEKNHTFSSTAAVSFASATMTGKGEPQFLVGQRVTPSFFSVLGVAPTLGRGFRDEENVRGSPRVVILTHALWRNRFSGDSTIVGKPITLDGNSFVVVGVMPVNFEYVISPNMQFLTPLRYDVSLPQACRSCRHLRMIARRKPGVTTSQVESDLKAISAELTHAYPKDYAQVGLMSPKLGDDTVRGVKPALLAVLGAVVLVLLVACLNVMNLLLARGAQREGEFAVRAALGAGRARIVRQLLAESTLLAFLGGAAGIVVAVVGVKMLVALSPTDLPRLSAIEIKGSVLAFAVGVTSVVGILFGLVPAFHASRAHLSDSIRRTTRRSAATSRLTRSTLVVSEVALAIVLLVGSGLLFRSMEKLFSVNPGFDIQNLLTMQIQSGAGRLRNDTLVATFYDDALKAVRSRPEIVSAAFTSQLPLSDDHDMYGVHFESKPVVNPSEDGDGFRYAVSDGYFETMKIPLVAGRYLNATDVANALPVVVLNQSFARNNFGAQSPLGQRLKVGGMDGPWREVVGIVGDVKHESLASDQMRAVYLPEAQWQFADYARTLVARTRTTPELIASSLRSVIWSVDKDQPIIRIATAERLIADRAAERRFALVLFEGFAIVALVLAAAGIYGVLAGTVSERGRELGVRAALGATSRDQVGMVLRQGMTLTGIGMIVGLGASLASSRILTSMLFNVSPLDLPTYAGVVGGLVCVALLACWIPARRASQTSPLEALKAD